MPENALRHFGGVPLLLNLDNLKAAVFKADWFDPQFNPKLADFAANATSTLWQARGVSCVRGNALKGRRFKSLAEENA